MNLSDPETNTFVLVVVGGTLFLVVVLPVLWSRLSARTRPPAPNYRTRPSRPAHGRLTDSQGIPCLHCGARVGTFSAMDIHLKFECPGLGRKEQE